LAGETADRYDPTPKILFCCGACRFSCGGGLYPAVAAGPPAADADLCRCRIFGIGRAFSMPAGASLVPLLVPIDELPKAIAWNTFSVQSGMILGPWVGGVLCELTPAYANATACALFLLACITWAVSIENAPGSQSQKQRRFAPDDVSAKDCRIYGAAKIVLARYRLTCLPFFWAESRHCCPPMPKTSFYRPPKVSGISRASFAAGAGCLTLCLALRPIKKHAGKWMNGWRDAPRPRHALLPPFHAMYGFSCWRLP